MAMSLSVSIFASIRPTPNNGVQGLAPGHNIMTVPLPLLMSVSPALESTICAVHPESTTHVLTPPGGHGVRRWSRHSPRSRQISVRRSWSQSRPLRNVVGSIRQLTVVVASSAPRSQPRCGLPGHKRSTCRVRRLPAAVATWLLVAALGRPHCRRVCSSRRRRPRGAWDCLASHFHSCLPGPFGARLLLLGQLAMTWPGSPQVKHNPFSLASAARAFLAASTAAWTPRATFLFQLVTDLILHCSS